MTAVTLSTEQTAGPPIAPAPVRRRGGEIFLWLNVAALFLASRTAILSIPLERDEGEYAYIASRMLAGETPYKDLFNQKPPGVFVYYAVAFLTAGASIIAIHGLLALVTGLTTALLAVTLLRTGHARAAPWAALAFVISSASPRVLGPSANTEHFANFGLALLALASVEFRRQPGRAWLIVGGAAAGAACLCKQVALLPVLVLTAHLLVRRPRESSRRTIGDHDPAGAEPSRGDIVARPACACPQADRSPSAADWRQFKLAAPASVAARPSVSRSGAVGWFLLGGAALLVPVLYFFAASDALRSLLDAVLLHNLDYIRRNTLAESASALKRALGHQWPCLMPLAILGAACLCVPPPRQVAVVTPRPSRSACPADKPAPALPLTWLAAAGVAATISLNFYDHYSIWLLPPLCVLAGIGVERLVDFERRILRRGTRAGAPGLIASLLALLLVAGVPLFADRAFWLAKSAHERARLLYGQNLVVEGPEIGRFLRENANPTDRVLIMGSEPQLLFYAGLRSATRYIIMYPLFGPYADAAERQAEVIGGIEASPPDWILDVQVWSSRTPHASRPLDLEKKIGAMLVAEGRYRLVGVAIPRVHEKRYDLRWGEELALLGDRAVRAAQGGVLIYRRAVSPDSPRREEPSSLNARPR